MITYPDWYKGGYPDAEKLMETLFTPLISGVTPVKWLPKESVIESTLQAGGGYLRIYRTGGRIDFENQRDEPNVQFVAMTMSRDKSWELIEFVRQVLAQYVERAGVVPGTTDKLGCSGELLGPNLTPGEMRDERLVPATFTLQTWGPGGLDKYRQALGL